jgi:flagella basal body P-ring formation protein FlgA
VNLALPLIVLIALASTGAPTHIVSADAIAQAVHTELSQRLAPGSRVQLRVVGRITDQILPPGTVRIALGSIAGNWPRAHVGVPVQLLVDDHLVRSLTVWVELTDARTVLTYATTYPLHLAADRLSLVPAVVDMTCCEGAVIGAAVTQTDIWLKHAVRAGQPAMAADIETMPDVVAQQRVTIDVIHGPVHLRTPGIALRDAHIGDRVDVRPDQSLDTVSSRVVAKQHVVVE